MYALAVLWIMDRLGVGPIGTTNYVVYSSTDPGLGYVMDLVGVGLQCFVAAWALDKAWRKGPFWKTVWLLVGCLFPVACTASLHRPHSHFPGPQATVAERQAWANRTFGVWYATSSQAVMQAPEVRRLVGEPVRLDIAEGVNQAGAYEYAVQDGRPERLGARGRFTFKVSGPLGEALAEVHFSHRTPERFPVPPRWGQPLPGTFKLTGQLVRSGAAPIPLPERVLWRGPLRTGH